MLALVPDPSQLGLAPGHGGHRPGPGLGFRHGRPLAQGEEPVGRAGLELAIYEGQRPVPGEAPCAFVRGDGGVPSRPVELEAVGLMHPTGREVDLGHRLHARRGV